MKKKGLLTLSVCLLVHVNIAFARSPTATRGATGDRPVTFLRPAVAQQEDHTDAAAVRSDITLHIVKKLGDSNEERPASAGRLQGSPSAVRLKPEGDPQNGESQEASENVIDEARHQVDEDVKRTRENLGKVRIKTVDKAVHHDFYTVRDIYLAGFTWRPFHLKVSMGVFIPSLIWLIIYFHCVFSADRYRHQHQFVGSANRSNSGDIAFVFEHPLGPDAESDRGQIVDPRTFIGPVFKNHVEEFPRVLKLMNDCDEVDKAYAKEHHTLFSPRTADVLEAQTDQIEEEKAQVGEEDELLHLSLLNTFTQATLGATIYKVSLHDVKVALLQDTCELLSHLSCEVQTFCSIDKDEIYVCCSMTNEGMINEQLVANDTHLQLRPDIIPKLGIKYPDFNESQCHEYEPPFVRFDPTGLVKRLYKHEVISSDDPVLVYKANVHNKQPGFIGGSERLRIIYKRISRLWDCDGAVDRGIMLAWYPMHNEDRIGKLLEKWGSFRLLSDLTFFQPLVSVFHYFGARVAFMVAWNGLYAKALLGLAPVAIIIAGMNWLAWFLSLDEELVHTNPFGIGFSFILVIWCRIAVNLWSQEQHFLCQDFNMAEEGGLVLPSYRGEWRASPVDLNTQEKYFPTHYLVMWRLFSVSVVSAFCGLVFVTTYFWDFLFGGQVTLTGAVLLAIQIKVFELLFHAMATRLTELENYKFQRDWYDSFLWKKFIFYAVNSYYPFFYLSVIQGAAQGRCPSDCVLLLRRKLIMTMAVLTLLRLVQVIMASVVLDLKIWWEARQLRNSGVYPPGQEPEASYEERQAKAQPYRSADHCESMLQLVLPLGFVMIFGPSAPFVVVLCLILFAINIRSTGNLLLFSMRRAFPYRAIGIGAWKDVIDVLMKTGVLANGFFLVQYGITFRNTPVLTKCTGIVLFGVTSALMCKLVDAVVPEEAEEVKLLIKRREHVLNRIAHLQDIKKKRSKKHTGEESVQIAAKLPTPKTSPESSPRLPSHVPPGKCATAVLEGRWEDVPLFPGARVHGAKDGDKRPVAQEQSF